MATYTAEEVREAGNLIEVADLEAMLQTTEPVSPTLFETGPGISVRVADNWNDEIEAIGADDPVDASITIELPNGQKREVPLSRDALLEVSSRHGLPKPYMSRVPGHLIEDNINYHFQGKEGTKAYQVLEVNGLGVAVIRGTLTPFSNLALLEEGIKGIENVYGKGTKVMVAPHVHNTLRRSDFRLVIPADERTTHVVPSYRNTDDNPDLWCVGANFHNSLIGETLTDIDTFMFAFWCANGCITEHGHSKTWNRKSRGQDPNDVYEWARLSVEEAIGGLEEDTQRQLEHQFAMLDALTNTDLEGDVSTVLHDIFKTHGVPVSIREGIIERMADTGDESSYAVMQAITAAANDPELGPKQAEKAMRVGGLLPQIAHAKCSECHRLKLPA